MRITNSTILRGFNRDLNRITTLKNQIEHQITTTRAFSRASESPLAAAKALSVRKSLYYSAQYTENLKTANSFYTEAETSLLQVSEKLTDVTETIVAACNTTKDQQDWNIYAQQLETYAQELCSILNTDTAGRAIFGGESNSSMPFSIIKDSDGNLATVTYHGIPINAMNDYRGFPFSNDVNVDIGLGMVIDQATQETNSQSLLCISFNGANVTGCGAEYGVADVDLSSIKENRNYCIDVYAGGIKKTIEFTGKATQAENVQLINDKLDEAYRKEINAYGLDHPVMDDQGVISLRVNGDENTAVEGGICSVVNNPNATRVETLVVDNDAGYTNKYKVNVEFLAEGQVCSIDVTVGDEKKTISFMASSADDPTERDNENIQSIQAALDEAFGAGNVSISASDATKGIISAEGKSVSLIMHDPAADTVYDSIGITSSSVDKLMITNLTDGDTYSFSATYGGDTKTITFTAGATLSDNVTAIETALSNAFNNATFAVSTDGDKTGSVTAGGVNIALSKDSTSGANSLSTSKFTTYTAGISGLQSGSTYTVKVIYGTSAKDVSFTAGADDSTTAANFQTALDNAFGAGTVTLGTDGTITAADNKSVILSNSISTEGSVVERETVYSNNYIQLTLDAARALRSGDIAYASGCLDRIASAKESLLVEIANLGCNEEFIEFNLDRITTRTENLDERQNDLEIIDPAAAISLWKTYTSMYNACLQMSTSVIPTSIFNYIS